jgi:hypothetical protein
MKDNGHAQAVPQEILAQAWTKITEVKTLLAPYIVALTPSERHELPKMGRETIGFVKEAFDFARQNPNLVPPYLDMTAFGADFEDTHGLWALVNSIRQLGENTGDTEMAAGSDAYQVTLTFYNVQMAAKGNVPGTKVLFGDMEPASPATNNLD